MNLHGAVNEKPSTLTFDKVFKPATSHKQTRESAQQTVAEEGLMLVPYTHEAQRFVTLVESKLATFQQLLDLGPDDFKLEGPISNSTSGTYLVSDPYGNRWIFKPDDEEAFRPPECGSDDSDESGQLFLDDSATRPEQWRQQGKLVLFSGNASGERKVLLRGNKVPLRRGVIHGQGSKKEYAAFLLDHESFAGVPKTFLARIRTGQNIVQTGSIQEFTPHIGNAEDMSSGKFACEQVHRIGILDIRILNLDRHLGNLLVSRSETGPAGTPLFDLTPIDHGYALPSFKDTSDVNLEWLYWKQCKMPFSKETLGYIQRLDPFADGFLLNQLGLEHECVLACVLSTILLQRAAAQGLTLFHIGKMVQRKGLGENKSIFEGIIDRSLATAEEVHATPESRTGSASPIPGSKVKFVERAEQTELKSDNISSVVTAPETGASSSDSVSTSPIQPRDLTKLLTFLDPVPVPEKGIKNRSRPDPLEVHFTLQPFPPSLSQYNQESPPSSIIGSTSPLESLLPLSPPLPALPPLDSISPESYTASGRESPTLLSLPGPLELITKENKRENKTKASLRRISEVFVASNRGDSPLVSPSSTPAISPSASPARSFVQPPSLDGANTPLSSPHRQTLFISKSPNLEIAPAPVQPLDSSSAESPSETPFSKLNDKVVDSESDTSSNTNQADSKDSFHISEQSSLPDSRQKWLTRFLDACVVEMDKEIKKVANSSGVSAAFPLPMPKVGVFRTSRPEPTATIEPATPHFGGVSEPANHTEEASPVIPAERHTALPPLSI